MENFRKPSHASQGGALDGVTATIDRPRPTKPAVSPRPSAQHVHRTIFNDVQRTPRHASRGSSTEAAAVLAVPQPALQKISVDDLPSGPEVRDRQLRVKKHLIRKIVIRTAIVLAALALLTGGFLAVKAYVKTKDVFRGGAPGAAALNQNVNPAQLGSEGDGRINILLLGKGGLGHEGPDLTDTIIVASIDPVNKKVALLSIPRDLWVKIPGYGSAKINAAYPDALYAAQVRGKTSAQAQAAGIKEIETVVQNTMGIPIHYYAMVDFMAFRDAIDVVGGIDVNVTEQVYDPTMAWQNNWNPMIASVGEHHMDGKQALLYARSRHGSARGDFDRSERQRQIILALKDKLLSLGTFTNPVKISSLMTAFGDHVTTDMSLSEVMQLYGITKGINNTDVKSVGLADPPNDYVTTGMYDGQSVVLPKAGIYDFSAIQSYVRNTMKDGFIAKENAQIVVLNGSTVADAATKTAEKLKSYGYQVTHVGDAPTRNYPGTVLVDLTHGIKKYTKHYLEKRLGVTATNRLPSNDIVPGAADFVIIIGKNDVIGQ